MNIHISCNPSIQPLAIYSREIPVNVYQKTNTQKRGLSVIAHYRKILESTLASMNRKMNNIL